MAATMLQLHHDVVTGLVPVIPIVWNAAPHRIGMARADPRIKSGDGHDVRRMVLMARRRILA
jgi:hypothetical protein